MKKIKFIFLILFTSQSFLLTVPQAFACSCADGGPQGAYEGADVVFLGTVASRVVLKESDSRYRPDFPRGFDEENQEILTFNVLRSWKGEIGKTAEVYNRHSLASCAGYYFDEEREYLFYIKKTEDGTLLQNHLCTGTRPSEFAADYLEHLGESIPEPTSFTPGSPIDQIPPEFVLDPPTQPPLASPDPVSAEPRENVPINNSSGGVSLFMVVLGFVAIGAGIFMLKRF